MAFLLNFKKCCRNDWETKIDLNLVKPSLKKPKRKPNFSPVVSEFQLL